MSKFNLLEGFDSGSNYKFGDKMNRENNPRSLFDLSHLVTTTIPNAGPLIPLTYFECLPGDDHYITADALLRVMPQVVPLYSRQRLYIYAFYSRYSDLWNNWQVFIDKGYTGNVSKKIPVLKKAINVQKQASGVDSSTLYTDEDVIKPDSLLDYLGLPIGASKASLFGSTSSATDFANISALPLMMYLRIYRDYFMNKDEWINDRVLLPDDDSRFRLDDDGRLLSAKDASKTIFFDYTQSSHESINDITIEGNYYLMGLLYHDYPNDYFTSAKPFTQRGSTPVIDKVIDTSQLGIEFTDDKISFYSDVYGSTVYNIGATNDETVQIGANNTSSSLGTINERLNKKLAEKISSSAKITGSNIGVKISLEDIRTLAIAQIELENMARTDGSYAQFGLTFFGEVSKAAHDYRPTFIGGTYKNISFTEVLQQSGSTVPTTAESGNSPLGAYAGHGITGITKGDIGRIHCDDYGMIMIIGCIMPDVYYSQGLDRILTDSLQSDKYLPDRAKLGMQPIYNKELYYAGNNGSDVGDDNYLWAYQSPFDYLRYIPNKIRGKIADPNNRSFRGYTQSRIFSNLVNWGRDFSEAKNVRKDYLFAPSEDAYTAQFSFNIRTVRELPYRAIPAQII